MTSITNATASTNYLHDSLPMIDELIGILLPMCGPRAAYTLRFDTTNGPRAEWTNDGISIIKSLAVKQNSINRMLLNSTAYIGGRIDSVAHDGTTTSMLIFLSLLGKLIKFLDPIIRKEFVTKGTSPATLHMVEDAFKNVTNELLSFIELRKLTTQDFIDAGVSEVEARRAIARNIAFISSKGNAQMSDAVAEIVSRTSDESADSVYQFTTDTYETRDLKITPVITDSQLRIKLGAYNEQINNVNLNTMFESDKAFIVAAPSFQKGDTDYNTCMEILKDEYEMLKAVAIMEDRTNVDDFSTIFITSNQFDPTIESRVDELNKIRRQLGLKGRLATVLVYKTRHFNDAQIAIIRALQSIDPSMSIPGSSRFKARVKLTTTYMDLFDIYPDEYGHGSDKVNSWIFDNRSNFPDFDNMLRMLATVIKNARNSISTNRVPSSEIEIFEDLYQQMTSRDVLRLNISGMSTDVQSAIPVITDACGSALAAVKTGVVFDGFTKLLIHLNDVADKSVEEKLTTATMDGNDPKLLQAVLSAIDDVYVECMASQKYTVNRAAFIERIIRKAYKDALTEVFSRVFGPRAFGMLLNENICAMSISEKTSHLYAERDGTVTHHVPELHELVANGVTTMQPFIGFEELFIRLNEVVPKYLRTVMYVQSEDI